MTSGLFWELAACTLQGKVNTFSRVIQLLVMLVPQFKKRDIERKGGKKSENFEKKLIENNLDDLKGTGGEGKD